MSTGGCIKDAPDTRHRRGAIVRRHQGSTGPYGSVLSPGSSLLIKCQCCSPMEFIVFFAFLSYASSAIFVINRATSSITLITCFDCANLS